MTRADEIREWVGHVDRLDRYEREKYGFLILAVALDHIDYLLDALEGYGEETTGYIPTIEEYLKVDPAELQRLLPNRRRDDHNDPK